jgi:hypothetical protein
MATGRVAMSADGIGCALLAPESRLAYGGAASRRRGLRRSREWGRFYAVLRSSAAS